MLISLFIYLFDGGGGGPALISSYHIYIYIYSTLQWNRLVIGLG